MLELVEAIVAESPPQPEHINKDTESVQGYSDWGDHSDGGGWSDSGFGRQPEAYTDHSDSWSDQGWP